VIRFALAGHEATVKPGARRRRCAPIAPWRAIAAAGVLLLPSSGSAQSPDGALARYAGNPLLAKGAAGSYDQLKIGPRAILREAPNVWKMWYEAVPGGNQSTTAYATSSDGLAWTKYAGNPVMTPSVAWEGNGGANHENSPTAILKEDGIYKLWYHAISNTTRAIGYAESKDGLTWTKYAGNPILTPGPMGAWDADTVCEPRVMRVGAQYYMFYTHCAGAHGIGLATSNDGKSWIKYAGNPVLTIGAGGAWDNQQVSWGEVYYDGQRFFMWYPGRKNTDTGGFSLGLATSTDGKVWTRSPNNPVMTPPAQPLNKGDDLGVESSPSVIRMGGTMRVYYGGFRFCCPEDTTVCLATTPATGVGNRAPIVDAGADQTIQQGTSATLDGTVMDDDSPVLLANVQVTWSKQTGPGTVTFANANSIDTTASFSAPGTYTLLLSASDTALMGSDTLVIVVSASGDAGGVESGASGAGGTQDGGGTAGAGGARTEGGVAGGGAGTGGQTGAGGAGGQTGTGASGGSVGAGGNSGSAGGGLAGSAMMGAAGGLTGAGDNGAPSGESSSGCGCRTSPSSGWSASLLAGIAAIVGATRRRSRQKQARM
jgi:predicted GH43/DUF377 family glycosyl hydrolase